jgi:hypothetical protein
MTWVEAFVAFVECHLVGDYLLQTDWQARHKHGGLRPGRGESRRALCSHVATYTMAFVPALLADGLETELTWTLPLIAIPHLLQDDGRLIAAYVRGVKGLEPTDDPAVTAAVDQTFHLLALLGVAALVSRRPARRGRRRFLSR